MADITAHPHYQEIHARIEALKTRIALKRQEAQMLFKAVLASINAAHSQQIPIPEELKAQLDAVRKSLKLDDVSKKEKEIETKPLSEVAMDDLLAALQSLTTPPGEQAMLSVKMMEEELKKIIAAEKHIKEAEINGAWKAQLDARHLASMLSQAHIKPKADRFGGADKLLQNAVELAENFSMAYEALANIGTDLSAPPAMQKATQGIQK